MSIRDQVAFYLEDSKSTTGKIIDLVLLGFNLIACALFVINSSYAGKLPTHLATIEIILVSVFTIEYILRLWIAKKKLQYIFSFYGIVDFVSIMPSLITLSKLRFLSGLKVLRILRFLRFLETDTFFFGKVSKLQLQVARTIFTVFTILFVSAGFILYFESIHVEPLIKSFSDAFYFCVVTLSTVGFGDLTPVTEGGRWATVIMILGGAVLVPFQAGKLVRTLLNSDNKKRNITCNVCGLIGHDNDASHCKSCGAVIYQEYSSQD